MKRIDPPALGVFLILFASDAFFWHSRDWNTGSRLMLTYALVDRGTVRITGLERQTGDKAYVGGQFYSDKLPGYPLLAALPYALGRWAFGLPPHPLGRPAIDYWAADYWVTLLTSGLLTAWTGALLVLMARDIGCTRGAAVLVGLAYGLATPAYVYATLAYGHQACAFALLASFQLIRKEAATRRSLRLFAAGFLAAWASVIELQVGPASAILGIYLLAVAWGRGEGWRAVGAFSAGAAIPTIALLGYDQVAFGSPFDMGYFHHVTFSHVHTRSNPLGLGLPDWDNLEPLLWGEYRGLFYYAPVLILALPGWVVLWPRDRRALATVSFLVSASVVLVNLCYPEWTGGWSTGPRLLLPLLPFAMLAVAGLLATAGPLRTPLAWAAGGLALVGGIEMLLFQGVGGRIPNLFGYPMTMVVRPLWLGAEPDPSAGIYYRFDRNLVTLWLGHQIARLGRRWEPIQFLPLVLGQLLAIVGLALLLRRPEIPPNRDAAASGESRKHLSP